MHTVVQGAVQVHAGIVERSRKPCEDISEDPLMVAHCLRLNGVGLLTLPVDVALLA